MSNRFWLWCWSLLTIGCSPTVYTQNVPNLVQVRAGLWRSGQPTTPEQWAYLRSLGITDVVKLNFATEGSSDGAITAGMVLHTLSIEPAGDVDAFDAFLNTFTHPDPQILNEAERVIEQSLVTLVHCTHGQDRTGLIIGRERVLWEGWTKDAAYSEMLANHFHPLLHGLQDTWSDWRP